MQAFCIADRRSPVFDGPARGLPAADGTRLVKPLIWAAEAFAGALLETLVHAKPGWDAEDQVSSRIFGDRWLVEQRTAVLLVPSLVTGGRERNVLLNPGHADFTQITASQPENSRWDERLFQRN